MKKTQLWNLLWAVGTVLLGLWACLGGLLRKQPGNGAGYWPSWLFVICAAVLYVVFLRLAPRPEEKYRYHLFSRADALLLGVITAVCTAFADISGLMAGGALFKTVGILLLASGVLTALVLLVAAFTCSFSVLKAGVALFELFCSVHIITATAGIFSQPDVLLHLPHLLVCACVGVSVWKLHDVSRKNGEGLQILAAAAAVGACAFPADAAFWLIYRENTFGTLTAERLTFTVLFGAYLVWLNATLRNRPQIAAEEETTCSN